MIGALIGVGIVCFLLLMLHQILDTEKHFIFQLLIIVFVMTGALLVVPKMIIDDYTVCENVINTTDTVGATVTYTYMLECNPHPSGIDVTFYKISTTFFYLFIGYIVVFLAFWSFFRLRDSVSGGKSG